MSLSFSSTSLSFSESPFSLPKLTHQCSNFHTITYASNNFRSVTSVGGSTFCRRFRGFKLWILDTLNFQMMKQQPNCRNHFENDMETEGSVSDSSHVPDADSKATSFTESTSLLQTIPLTAPVDVSREPSLCIAVIGATGELARGKIFSALFSLYYSGFLPENVAIFGYPRKNITDEDLRSIIASTLTCRVDHQQNCGDKLEAFLDRTHYINGGWQSACCTTTLSVYPLPAVPNKRHARVGGRKMSGSAFNKLLSRLTAENQQRRLTSGIDLHQESVLS